MAGGPKEVISARACPRRAVGAIRGRCLYAITTCLASVVSIQHRRWCIVERSSSRRASQPYEASGADRVVTAMPITVKSKFILHCDVNGRMHNHTLLY